MKVHELCNHLILDAGCRIVISVRGEKPVYITPEDNANENYHRCDDLSVRYIFHQVNGLYVICDR